MFFYLQMVFITVYSTFSSLKFGNCFVHSFMFACSFDEADPHLREKEKSQLACLWRRFGNSLSVNKLALQY